MGKGDERPKKRSGSMTGMDKRARRMDAMVRVATVISPGGSGYIPPHLLHARSIMVMRHPRKFRSEQAVFNYINSPGCNPRYEREYSHIVQLCQPLPPD